jgi:hypothetical protein
MEPENLLKGLRAAAINRITAEHVSLGWKRFFHLVAHFMRPLHSYYWFSMANIPGQFERSRE